MLDTQSNAPLQTGVSFSVPTSTPLETQLTTNPTRMAAATAAPLKSGLTAEYFDHSDLTERVRSRTDATIDFNWGTGSPDAAIAPDTFSARWSGMVRPKYSETYAFHTVSDDGLRLWVDGKLLIDHWSDHAATEDVATIRLAAGKDYDIKLEYFENSGGAIAQLLWSSASQAKEIIPASQLFSPLEQTIPGKALTTPQQARSASSFIDSLGIVTHLRYTDTSYGRYNDVIEPRLLELGIKHIRDGGNDADMFEKLNRLAGFGIRSTLVMDPRDGITPENAVSVVKRAAASVIAVEGPNEWDVHLDQMYNGEPFPNGIRTYQTNLYRSMKGDGATAWIPVLAPSLAHPESSTQIGSLTRVSDMANMHSYAGGNAPASDYDWRWLPMTKSVSDRPIVVTETGWHNATSDVKAGQRGVSEQVSAKYIPRQYLENFNHGIQRTFMYELMDERPIAKQEDSFGLVRYDGSVKPAFTAVKNLITLLNDTPGSSASGTLDFSLTGNTENVHHTLLQKSNGEFYLVMWANVTSTDALKSQNVTVNLSTPIRQATAYFSNQSLTPVGEYAAPKQVSIDVLDEPVIVKLTPG